MLKINTIHCGMAEVLLAKIPPKRVDLVVTSPPYDNLRSYGSKLNWNFGCVANHLYRVLKPGGVLIWVVADSTIKGSETLTSMKQAIYFQSLGLNVHDTMIYLSDKPPLTHRRYEQCWEYMFVFSKGSPKTWNPIKRIATRPNHLTGKFIHSSDSEIFEDAHSRKRTPIEVLERNAWSFYTGGHLTRTGHPAVFPIDLANNHIISWSNPGDLVLDPFVGSGTTCIAAKKLGRDFIGIDVVQKYCDIANNRLQLT